MREFAADVVIVGGGVGGCAAALAAARSGRSVILTEETNWIGGQLTAQATPPDEHPWIESFGCTRTYREFRNRVRDYYRRNYPLSREARERWNLNPGDGSVSRLCHEPRAALAVLHEMLAPFVSAGTIRVLLHQRAIRADVDGDFVRAVALRDLLTGDETVLTAPYFLDATELGDLLPLSGTEFVTGAESQSETGEPHAAPVAQPDNQQAFTMCFAMDYRNGEEWTIDRPEEYAFWRGYIPGLTPAWPGPLLALTYSSPFTLKPQRAVFDPQNESRNKASGFWRYRRILAGSHFADNAALSDICLVNWPMNDYLLGNLVGVSEEEAAEHIRRAKQLSLSLFYWLQTEAPRPDGGTGWPGLRLRPNVVGTADGLAKAPYIRESRRIKAEFTILEQQVGTEARMAETGQSKEDVKAAIYPDSIGVGAYRIDLHPSTGGDNYIDISSLPFQIPLGALIPARMENIISACKNIGTTHITNGCYRLHPTEWNIGEAAGFLAAACLNQNISPRALRNTPALLEDFQKSLRNDGAETHWPQLRPL